MAEGRLEEIYVAAAGQAPMQARPEVQVLASGLDGDRYAGGEGTFSSGAKAGRHVTLIEAEAVAAVNAEERAGLTVDQTRRNLVTRGVALNHLVGRRFRVGGVELRGVRLCEPCQMIETVCGPGMRQAFLHRCGLRADVVVPGTIAVGDEIVDLGVTTGTQPS